MLMRYAFTDLAASRMTTRARLDNSNMIRSALHYGFTRHADQLHGGTLYAEFSMTHAQVLRMSIGSIQAWARREMHADRKPEPWD